MKHFWIAVALLILSVLLTVFNAFFVQNEVESLRAIALEDNAKETVRSFTEAEPFLALTANHIVLEQAQNAALEMAVYREQYGADYFAARERFLTALDEISEGEKFSLSNIF